MNKIIPTEHEECVALVQYMSMKNIKYHHINSETWTTSWKQKHKAKSEGVVKGFPDYAIIIKDKSNNNRLVFIEMKRTKGGRLSPEQKEWIKELNKCKGVKAYICKGFLEAKEVVDKYTKK